MIMESYLHGFDDDHLQTQYLKMYPPF
ncbi:hypothetical protein FBALC1_17192 [Flavobacteriales bacterium ALC-1]|nr:hypothetical protein FBALC1_17192 [Flavobacteriales bacterium ALC-1]